MSGFTGLSYESTDNVPSFRAFCETSLVLPIRLFFTEPIVFCTSIMAATVCAVVYLFPEAFPVVFIDIFEFTPRQCAIVNLAIPVGVVFTFLTRLYDIRVSNIRRQNNIVAQPEDKIFGFLVAAPILAIAFWWFGLTVPPLKKASHLGSQSRRLRSSAPQSSNSTPSSQATLRILTRRTRHLPTRRFLS